MVQPLAIVGVIAVVLVIGYVLYALVLNHPASSTPITTVAQSSVTSNSTTNSMSGNYVSPNAANVIKIYERDYQGSQVNFSITPKNVNVITGTNISFYVMNQGKIPHGINITGPVNVNGILLNTTMMTANGIVNTSVVIFSIGLGNVIAPGANVFFNFTAPAPGNYTIFSPIAGQEALGLKANLRVS